MEKNHSVVGGLTHASIGSTYKVAPDGQLGQMGEHNVKS